MTLIVVPQRMEVQYGVGGHAVICPACNAIDPRAIQQGNVLEVAPRSVRFQDRRCAACGHQWRLVLAPTMFSAHG